MQLYQHEQHLVHQGKRVHKKHHLPDNVLVVSPQNFKCVWGPAGIRLKKAEQNRIDRLEDHLL